MSTAVQSVCQCRSFLLAAAAVVASAAVVGSDERGRDKVGSEAGKVREERQRCRIHLFSTISCTDTNQVHCAQALFIGGLLSIVSLEVFAEPCDLGQGLREANNNSEREGAVFRANFKNCVTSLAKKGGREPEQPQIRTAR